ncbi:helix-turn-helix domain-containing protein [Exiguobacterium oxidotolerans]|uniref:helix-turn-helix domain-containing protein n=1 Tax=Exiguobacterium oxidotolerans TaxID=223958 RepID=UPI0006907EDC|nr:helix-turn-helix domain-containing protein [Exiguobacterium oxidotolerans]
MGKIAQTEHPRILQLWRQGMHQRDIAARYDVSTITIYRIIRASNGGTTRGKHVPSPGYKMLWRLYITESYRQVDIAVRYGVSPTTVKRWLGKAGIVKSWEQRVHERRKVQPPDEDTLYTLYILDDLTAKVIGSRYGVSQSVVYRWLDEAELKKHKEATG